MERVDTKSEEGSAAEDARNGREGTAEVVGGVVEVPEPATVGTAIGKGEGGASDKLRTAI